MAKVLLVEDDNNLREIYEARLQAEGYEIVAAKDGEEALVVAKKEQPDLVIADVMMPRISGFEMLDILRNTQGMKDLKVIMLTALGQAEDKARADALGADRYLVKSQVTLEDIIKAASELLGTYAATPAPAAPTPATATASIPMAQPPAAPSPAPAPAAPVVQAPIAPTPPPAAPLPPAPIPAAPAPPAPVVSVPVIEPPVAPPPPPPPAPTPPVAPPTPPILPAPSSPTDQLVVSAVNDLVAGSPSAPPAPPQPLVITPPTSTPPNPAATVSSTPAPDDVVHRKTISPLAPGQGGPTAPDLTALLAKEGLTNLDGSPTSAGNLGGSHPPGHVISPNPTSPDGSPLDPNKISL